MTEEQKPVEEKEQVGETPTPEVQSEVKIEAPKQPELTPEQKTQMEKQKEFFQKIRLGGYFLQFVHEDLQRQKKAQGNRHQRRRLERELRKGEISPELVNAYVAKIDMIMEYFEEKLNPKPIEPVQEVDEAEFYAQAKEAEAKGEIKDQPPESGFNPMAQ